MPRSSGSRSTPRSVRFNGRRRRTRTRTALNCPPATLSDERMRFDRRATTVVVSLVGVLVAIGSSPQGQTRRPMTLVDLAELTRLIFPQLSPDGRSLAYLQSRADWKAGRPVWHLWRQTVGGGPPAQLTFTDRGDIPIQ